VVKILGVCGSPRTGATEYVIKEALKEASKVKDVQVELITLKGKKINFCIHCDKCVKQEADYCVIFDDDMTDLYQPFYHADGYIVASPVYNMNVTGQLATFFNRFRPNYTILKKNPDYFSSRVGGAIAVGGTRNGGQEQTINAILGFYYTQGIMTVSGGLGTYHGASVWSKDKKALGAQEDLEGLENARKIGRKVAEAARLIKLNQAT